MSEISLIITMVSAASSILALILVLRQCAADAREIALMVKGGEELLRSLEERDE